MKKSKILEAVRNIPDDAKILAAVLHDSNDAIIIQDFKGKILAWNKGAEKIYGYTKEKALNMNAHELIPKSKVPEAIKFIKQVTAGKTAQPFETQRQTKTGKIIEIILTATKLQYGQEKIISIITTTRNITERKKELEEIERMATVVKDSNDAIIIQDFKGKILAWNKGAEKIYGYTEKEILGKNIDQIIIEQERPSAQKQLHNIQQGKPTYRAEQTRKTKTGQTKTVDITYTPIKEHNKITKIATTERDITEKKKAEETTKRLASVLQDSNDAIIIQDFKGKILAWNRGAEEIYGYTEKEMLGNNINRIITEQERPSAKKQIRQIQEGKPTFRAVQARKTKKGQIKYVDITYTPIKEKGKITRVATTEKDITGIATTERDITEKKQKAEELQKAYEELKRLDEMKATIVRDTAHELKTPIALITMAVNLLSDEIAKKESMPEKIAEYISILKSNAKRFETETSKILEFNKLQSTEQLEKKPTDVREVIKNILKDSQLLAQQKNLQLKYSQEKVPKINANYELIRTMIRNLIDNAIKFTEKGQVEITCKKQNKSIIISIKDTGIGISGEDLKNLFKPFAKADPSAKGMGLGLMISRRIAEMHNGKITAESKPGKGSTFTITIPLTR